MENVKSVYAIHDKTAEEFGPPFIAKNDGVAVRNFKQYMQNSPDFQDYALFCIGTYCSINGKLEPTTLRYVNYLEKEGNENE